MQSDRIPTFEGKYTIFQSDISCQPGYSVLFLIVYSPVHKNLTCLQFSSGVKNLLKYVAYGAHDENSCGHSLKRLGLNVNGYMKI